MNANPPQARIVVGRIRNTARRRVTVGAMPSSRFMDAIVPANAGTHLYSPGDPIEYIPPGAARFGNQAVTFHRAGAGPYVAGLDDDNGPEIVDGDAGSQGYRYVYDDETGLVVRFEHSLSPDVKKVIEEVRKPAKIASAGMVVGMLAGAIAIGLLFVKAFADADDVDLEEEEE